MGNVDLFGEAARPEPKKPLNMTGKKLHGNMTAVYGLVDNKCKNCKHLRRYRYSQTFYKCNIADPGGKTGPSGDWRVNYQACGKFERDSNV